MVKFDFLDKDKNIAMLSFSTMQMPTFKVIESKGYVEFGKKNDFPNQLLRLYEEHPEHGAIVGAKANYLLGDGVKAKDEANQPYLDQWLAFANRYENWTELGEKIKVDAELFNSFYLQVITDLTGKPKEYYHLQYANCRVSKERGKLFYKENWLDRQCEQKEYEIYEPGKVGVFFIRFEYYKPVGNKLAGVYPMPQYIGCIKDISTDIDISTFNNNYVANGFSAGTIITFFNGIPTPDEQRKIKERLLNTHSSPDKAGSIVVNFAEKDSQAAEIKALTVDDLDKKFEFTSKRALDKIIRGHNVTNPELFGVKTEGQLGTRVSLSESYELMLNTYTLPRQKILMSFFSQLIYLQTGQKIELEVKQLRPIGFDLSNDQDLTQDERRVYKGYEPLTVVPTDENGQPVPVEAAAVNDNLKGLSASENADMIRIVRDFQKGRNGMNEHMAISRLKAFGLNEDEAKKWLGIEEAPLVKMSAQTDDFILAQFAAIDTTDSRELELLEEFESHIHSSKQALSFETIMELKFASEPKKLNWLNRLVNAITGKTDTLTPSEINDIAKEERPDEKIEIVTKYHYALKAGAPDLKGGKSRSFCQKMMALSEQGKEYTFEQIDKVRLAGFSNGMPEVDNIWDYRGGFYTNPNTGETDPFCRHIWKARTYKVITKK